MTYDQWKCTDNSEYLDECDDVDPDELCVQCVYYRRRLDQLRAELAARPPMPPAPADIGW